MNVSDMARLSTGAPAEVDAATSSATATVPPTRVGSRGTWVAAVAVFGALVLVFPPPSRQAQSGARDCDLQRITEQQQEPPPPSVVARGLGGPLTFVAPPPWLVPARIDEVHHLVEAAAPPDGWPFAGLDALEYTVRDAFLVNRRSDRVYPWLANETTMTSVDRRHQPGHFAVPSQVDRVVIEVGPNTAPEVFRLYKRRASAPTTLFVLVEPLTIDLRHKCHGRFPGRCLLLPSAAGLQNGHLALHAAEKCSSVLGGAKTGCAVTNVTLNVSVLTLDAIVEALPRHLPVPLVVLDCQGMDLGVAASLRRHRARVGMLVLECQDVPLHDTSTLISPRAMTCGQAMDCITKQWAWRFVHCYYNTYHVRELNCAFRNPEQPLAVTNLDLLNPVYRKAKTGEMADPAAPRRFSPDHYAPVPIRHAAVCPPFFSNNTLSGSVLCRGRRGPAYANKLVTWSLSLKENHHVVVGHVDPFGHLDLGDAVTLAIVAISSRKDTGNMSIFALVQVVFGVREEAIQRSWGLISLQPWGSRDEIVPSCGAAACVSLPGRLEPGDRVGSDPSGGQEGNVSAISFTSLLFAIHPEILAAPLHILLSAGEDSELESLVGLERVPTVGSLRVAVLCQQAAAAAAGAAGASSCSGGTMNERVLRVTRGRWRLAIGEGACSSSSLLGLAWCFLARLS